LPTARSKAAPHPDVVFTDLDNDEAVLLHLGTQTYFSLNQTGACIWRLMGDGLTLGEIARELEARFEVETEQAQRSVNELASELASEGLVELAEDPAVSS
jgi:hypothetical protein